MMETLWLHSRFIKALRLQHALCPFAFLMEYLAFTWIFLYFPFLNALVLYLYVPHNTSDADGGYRPGEKLTSHPDHSLEEDSSEWASP